MTFLVGQSCCFSRLKDRLFHGYCRLVFGRPLLLIISTVIVSCLLSAVGIHFNYNAINFDPSKGFETRGTTLSEGKMLLNGLEELVAAPIDIYKSRNRVKRLAEVFNDAVLPLLNDSSVEILDGNDFSNSTYEPITMNYEEYGVDSEPNENDVLNDPCTQYLAIGKQIPYDIIELMSKIVVESQNLFTVKSFQVLCGIDSIIEETVKETDMRKIRVSQLKHSINLPMISLCMNPSVTKKCTNINQADIDNLKKTITRCQSDKNSLEICKLEIIHQAAELLLPKDKSLPYVSAFMPLQRAYDDQSIRFFEKLEKKLKKHFSENGLKQRGIDFGTKTKKFHDALLYDSLLSSISATLVLAIFYLYSGSVIFTFIILSMVVLSMTLAFFTYTVILGIDFFPFLNLLVIVLMTSIGADDAFLLLSYYKLEKKHLSGPWRPGDMYLPGSSLHIRSLQTSLRHSLMSMFITSATTAVAFLSNLSGDIVVLRCFGIYACLTVLFNFCLVIFILPATIMLTQSGEHSLTLNFSTNKFMDFFARALQKVKWIVILIGALLTAFSVFVTFFNPGLTLPEYNPTKLLVDSNPAEWYDNNAHLFNFEWKRTYMIQKFFIIDKISITGKPFLSSSNNGKLKAGKVKFSSKNLKHIEQAVNTVLQSSGRNPNNSWITGLEASNCSRETFVSTKCYVDHCFERLPSPFPDDFSKYPSDGPLLTKDLDLIGYYLSTPSKVKLTAASIKVSEAFEEINRDCEVMKGYLENLPLRCLSSSEITRYYDIIGKLRSSTLSSVLISVFVSLVVVILCTQQFVLSLITVGVICAVVLWTTSTLVLLGWQLSVVESTIIVLTIGLSFDFSLHTAASIKDSREIFMADKIRSAFHSAGTACFLAACSSVVCGIPLLFASTAAFYQVGVMLIALGIISLVGALILLPSCLLCIYVEKRIVLKM